MPDKCKAYLDMLQFNKENPEFKTLYKDMRLDHLKTDKNNGIFSSEEFVAMHPVFLKKIQGAMAGMVGSEGNLVAENIISSLTRTYIYGTWRNTLSIYRIDKDIYKEIKQAVIPPDTPTNIFFRLPEWCVYVELPEDNDLCAEQGLYGEDVEAARGFWAYLAYDPIDKTSCSLNFSIDYVESESNKNPTMVAFPVNLTKHETVLDSIKSVAQSALKEIDKDMEREQHRPEKLAKIQSSKASIIEGSKKDADIVIAMLSMVLWLCAEEPDITNLSGEPVTGEQMRMPNYTRKKKSQDFIPPNKPTVYVLGERLGGDIREFKSKTSTPTNRKSSRKRPHIRRGHWHGVWKGTGQDKHFSLYWQPAVFVNSSL